MNNNVWGKISNLQADLNRFIGFDTINYERKHDWIFRFSYQTMDELYEMREELHRININRAIEELIDVVHFTVSLTHLVDIDISSKECLEPQSYIDFSILLRDVNNAIEQCIKIQRCTLTKWWNKYYKEDNTRLFNYTINVDMARNYISDLFDTILLIISGMGLSADDLYKHYIRKWEVNRNRQLNGY